MRSDYREALAAVGFSELEAGLIEWTLIRMGVLPICEHIRPRFVECYSLHEDDAVNDARWQKTMQELGFRSDAITLAEHVVFSEQETGRC